MSHHTPQSSTPLTLTKFRQGTIATIQNVGQSASVLLVLISSGLMATQEGVHASPLPSGVQLVQTDPSQPSSEPGSVDVPTSPQTLSDTRFFCQFMEGDYTVMYTPISQPGQSYPWATPSTMGGGWTPEKRCYEISRRLEFYRPDGLLELQTSVENGYNTICVTTEQVPSCRIVLTVPPGQDPTITRDRVFSNLTVADGGQQTTAVNTFTGGDGGNLLNQIGNVIGVDLSSLSGRQSTNRSSTGIDLRPFLDPADGGTGTRLR